MEKKYQVFVSSTYKDLQNERQEVMQALLELDCIPVGMELFPAADDDQWTLIKGLISDCDYYVLIVAGRYGSIDKKTGKSYTQMEYEFAIEKNIPVISFVHKEPGNIPASNTESTDLGKVKLENFIELVENKMCQFWVSPEDLGSKVSRSLVKLIKAKPRVGWIKANEASSAEANKEILALKKENETLKQSVLKLEKEAKLGTETLCQGEDKLSLSFSYMNKSELSQKEIYLTWNEIIKNLAPILVNELKEQSIVKELNDIARTILINEIKPERNATIHDIKILADDFYTVKIQLIALGIIEKSNKKRSINDSSTYWRLTTYGESLMIKLIALKR